MFPLLGRQRSIARKLAFLHIISFFISFSIGAFLLYMNQVEQLENISNKALLDQVSSIKSMLRAPQAEEILIQEIRSQEFENADMRTYFRIKDRSGVDLIESPDMATIVPSAAFPPPASGLKSTKWQNPLGGSYLLRSIPLSDGLVFASGGMLQVAVGLNEEKTFENRFRLSLLFYFAWTMLFAVISSLFIARESLKPLAVMNKALHDYSTRTLDVRIDAAKLPGEVLPLVESLNAMLDRIEDTITRLSHYSANLAHELRTPVNNLMVEAGVALSQKRTPDEYRRVIGSSMDEYERLSQTIDRLLFLARADDKAIELALKMIDVRSEMEDIIDFHADLAAQSAVDITCYGEALLVADPDLFRRALSNLLYNAIKYTPRGGSITLSAQQDVDLSVEVFVTDTGCGIGQQHLERIFDRFYRADNVARNVAKGTGLGLAIVKAIMTMHGGSVDIRSVPGKGTTVSLKFPHSNISIN